MLPKRPDKIAGINIDGAMERYEKMMEEGKLKSNAEEDSDNNYQGDKDSFIYVPSIGLYLAKERSYTNKTWENTHKALNDDGLKMPTINQFAEYLKYLKGDYQTKGSREREEAVKILDDILTVRNPWRGEWLDAKFREENGKMFIDYDHRVENGSLVAGNSEKLEGYLNEDREPGIDLGDWLENKGKYGLPKQDAVRGDVYYWYPRDGCVARFNADSYGADLDCSWVPSGQSSSLGVFSVCEANATQ